MDNRICQASRHPHQHQEHALALFAKEAQNRWHLPFKNWEGDKVQGEVATWILDPKITQYPYDFHESWWKDMFRWVYENEVDALVEFI